MQQTVHVFAYLDAGTGSMLLQILLGGVAAAGVGGRVLWQRMRGRAAPKTDPSRDVTSLTEDTDDAAREETPALDPD
jgi:hypothetical protein